MRKNFSELFDTNKEGGITPRIPLKLINYIWDSNLTIKQGVLISGINPFWFKNCDLEIIEENSIFNIIGVYKNGKR